MPRKSSCCLLDIQHQLVVEDDNKLLYLEACNHNLVSLLEERRIDIEREVRDSNNLLALSVIPLLSGILGVIAGSMF